MKDIVVLIKPVIATILASSLFFLMLNTVLKIAIVLITYIALLFLLKTFKKEDWNIFKRVLNAAAPKTKFEPIS